MGLGACGSSSKASSAATTSSVPPPVRDTVLQPGERPNPSAAAGTDQLPQIENIVIVMMENHSYDNVLGMQRGRGDGFTLDSAGKPTQSNPWPEGSVFPPPAADATLHAFPMPTPCQEDEEPYNTWKSYWESYTDGANSGFVQSQSGPVSMGYIPPDVLPFVNSLAATFPVCDRWFCSVGAQTYPNRRFLMAGTSLGLTVDALNDDVPPNGTIFQALDAHGISWKNYWSSLPSSLIWSYQNHAPRLFVPPGRRQPVLPRRGFRVASLGEPGGPEFQHHVRGGSPGRPVRGPVPVQGGQRRDELTAVGPHPAGVDLRRVGRLLRPRVAALGADPRRRSPHDPAGRPAGVVRPLRLPGAPRASSPPTPARTTSPTWSTTTRRS